MTPSVLGRCVKSPRASHQQSRVTRSPPRAGIQPESVTAFTVPPLLAPVIGRDSVACL